MFNTSQSYNPGSLLLELHVFFVFFSFFFLALAVLKGKMKVRTLIIKQDVKRDISPHGFSCLRKYSFDFI